MLKILLVLGSAFLPLSVVNAQELIVAASGTLPLDTIEAGDGTLPLRLPNEGTLPLKLSGQATDRLAGNQIPTHISVAYADRRALNADQRTSLICQMVSSTVSKHTARGTVVLSGNNFSIKGICYDHANKKMEIVAQRATESSFMIGQLNSAVPEEFSGSLIINSPNTIRYSFALSSAE